MPTGPIPTDLIPIIAHRRAKCFSCPTPCADPNHYDPKAQCPLAEPRWLAETKEFGLGDLVHAFARPVAEILKLPCVDAAGKLKPNSMCAQRREAWNKKFPNLSREAILQKIREYRAQFIKP